MSLLEKMNPSAKNRKLLKLHNVMGGAHSFVGKSFRKEIFNYQGGGTLYFRNLTFEVSYRAKSENTNTRKAPIRCTASFYVDGLLFWTEKAGRHYTSDQFLTIYDQKNSYGELLRMELAAQSSIKDQLYILNKPLEDFRFENSLSIVIEAEFDHTSTAEMILETKTMTRGQETYEPFGIYFSIEQE